MKIELDSHLFYNKCDRDLRRPLWKETDRQLNEYMLDRLIGGLQGDLHDVIYDQLNRHLWSKILIQESFKEI